MAIDKIGSVTYTAPAGKKRPAGRSEAVAKNDKVEISKEALKGTEFQQALKIVKETPEIREDRIAAVKKKIEMNPDYFDGQEIIDHVAEAFLRDYPEI